MRTDFPAQAFIAYHEAGHAGDGLRLRAKALISEHWDGIARVAALLLSHGTVSGDAALAVFAADPRFA